MSPHCRLCKGIHFTEVINLGEQVITSRFPFLGESAIPKYAISIILCDDCKLVQLKDTTPPSEMYEHFYGYRSGINATMRQHLSSFNEEIRQRIPLTAGDSVLDIGSNDCTFLSNYPEDIMKYGCDPTGKQFEEYYKTTKTTLIPTYFTRDSITAALGDIVKFKIVTSISMFYDLPDPVQFAKDIFSVLSEDGLWCLEQSYVYLMLQRNSIDTICHEHLEYYGVKQIKEIMDRSGFKILDISLNECNGGSFRITVSKKSSTLFEENTECIHKFLSKEEEEKIHTVERYERFMKECSIESEKLTHFLHLAKKGGKTTYIYGASTKGNCLLQFAKIDSSLIPYAVERNVSKVGRTTSTGIEIISEERMRENPPDFMLVLPWHFRKEIIERETSFLEGGGQFLFPFPKFEVYSKRNKTLITGIDGQIGRYLKETLRPTDSIYGISRTLHCSKDALSIELNLDTTPCLEYIIRLLNPNRIIHLAGISNTEDCELNPYASIHINGSILATICNTIYLDKINCKVFNASSSELFKGHTEYTAIEGTLSMNPSTIYGISKLLGHTIVDYYRSKYNLPFSNGILFTTESRFRKNTFLFKKVSLHADIYAVTRKPLALGSLDSFRNINHAEDVASGIKLILEQEIGDTYILCNSNFLKVEDIVIDIYKNKRILLERNGNFLVDMESKEVVVILGSSFRDCSTKINGIPEKLLSLGWTPKHTLQSIITDISHIS